MDQMDRRVESEIVGTKITRPKDELHKNNLPKGRADRELNGQHENNSPKECTTQK